MKSRLHKRLAKLERKLRPAPEICLLWRDVLRGETADEVIEQAIRDGAPEDAQFVVVSWMPPEEPKDPIDQEEVALAASLQPTGSGGAEGPPP
ncbi:MAG TPA: hypothetical protein VFA23_10405 [Dongiaceae bacterium]|nr:hypothetical protein [Dongiaceae bacterium]